MKRNSGFTLVEILIVVIILGILAAIVIPQFTEASNDARQSALVSDMQTVRSQIELFKVQHCELLPGDDGSGSFTTARFLAHLTQKTDQDGTLNASGQYGPYLQKFPTNPFTSDNPDSVDVVTTDPNAGELDGDPGWWFNSGNGKFGANTAEHYGL
jgi:general secretion pathway protein G